MSRSADSNILIAVKFKQILSIGATFTLSQYAQMSYNQTLNYLKTHNKFYKDISITEGLSRKEMINFSGINENQNVAESIHKKKNSNETEYGSAEDSSSMHRTAVKETVLGSEFPRIINEVNVIIEPGQRKKTNSILCDEFCEKQAFTYLLPKV